MHRTKKLIALAAIAVAGLSVNWASAQSYSSGDLVLFFQNPNGSSGADQTLYVNLGNAQTFRGAATGADVANQLNIASIGSALTSAFGSNWASQTTLYAGLAAAHDNGTLGFNLAANNGDSKSTVYVSAPRVAVGTVGTANSSAYGSPNPYGSTAMVGIAGGIISMNATNPAIIGSLGVGSAQQFSTSNVNLDERNPFQSPGIQGTAFGYISGGIQQAGSASSFGTFDTVSNVEFALDLYRIAGEYTSNVNGSSLAGDVGGVGTFEGTFVVDNSGNVSYVTQTSAVPEPSTALALFLGLGGLFLTRRRRQAAI